MKTDTRVGNLRRERRGATTASTNRKAASMPTTEITRDDVADRLHGYLNRFAMSATERYEADAEAFYHETGLMAPGKDAPMAGHFGSDKERRAGYDAWVAARNDQLRDDIACAVLFLRQSPAAREATSTDSVSTNPEGDK